MSKLPLAFHFLAENGNIFQSEAGAPSGDGEMSDESLKLVGFSLFSWLAAKKTLTDAGIVDQNLIAKLDNSIEQNKKILQTSAFTIEFSQYVPDLMEEAVSGMSTATNLIKEDQVDENVKAILKRSVGITELLLLFGSEFTDKAKIQNFNKNTKKMLAVVNKKLKESSIAPPKAEALAPQAQPVKNEDSKKNENTSEDFANPKSDRSNVPSMSDFFAKKLYNYNPQSDPKPTQNYGSNNSNPDHAEKVDPTPIDPTSDHAHNNNLPQTNDDDDQNSSSDNISKDTDDTEISVVNKSAVIENNQLNLNEIKNAMQDIDKIEENEHYGDIEAPNCRHVTNILAMTAEHFLIFDNWAKSNCGLFTKNSKKIFKSESINIDPILKLDPNSTDNPAASEIVVTCLVKFILDLIDQDSIKEEDSRNFINNLNENYSVLCSLKEKKLLRHNLPDLKNIIKITQMIPGCLKLKYSATSAVIASCNLRYAISQLVKITSSV